MRILVADVGGTNARFRLLEATDASHGRVLAEGVVASAAHVSLADAARAFLGDSPAPSRACFAVAGPVVKGTCTATNLPWRMDEAELRRDLGLGQVRLVNDFYAVARGLEALSDDDLRVLQPGDVSPDGPRLLVGAGTGLGVAVALPASPPRVLSSEGGHLGFAPRDEQEDALLAHLRARHGRVSVERVVSGPGLASLYDFMVESGLVEGAASLSGAGDDRPARIAAAAASDAGAAQVLERFVSLYGAAAGDLALAVLASGGLYLAGGIAPKILDDAATRIFLEAFFDKGRMRPLLEATRVTLVTAGDVGLRGAAVACLDD
ncbi:MAG: glucokinase [Myxococcales bacterium]|nr:glucokinase [Myxococcales bacterium]